MKKQLFAFVMALTLVAFGVAFAQTTGQTLPPSQQVDQSGQPETGTGPDVDVDAGANAENGVLDVDVDSTTDSDTAATDRNTTTGTTATGATALQNEPEEGMDVDVDTGARAEGAVDVDVNRTSDADTDASGIDEGGALGDEDTTTTGVSGDTDSLPATASELPALALLGLLALAGAFAVRFVR